MKKTVVYISSCALHADGTPDPFLLQELPWLRKRFDRVLMCSAYGVAELGVDRPEKVRVTRSGMGTLLACLQAPFHRQFFAELRHLRADGSLNTVNALKLLAFTCRGLKLYRWIQPMLRKGEQTTFYAYWMSFDGFAAALCKRKMPQARAIARGHAFDIDVARNPLNPYLMKRFMSRTLDAIYPINQSAKEHILSYADVPPEKVRVVGAGSAGEVSETHFSAPRFEDGVYHVVSCAVMIEIKRIPLLIDALSMWEASKLHWVHIGGGEEEEKIRTYALEKLSAHPLVTYELTGSLPPEQVGDMYRTRPFDVFVNTSKNEGTPVSIMEALHAGIPVAAPRVGGIPELIDLSIGCLYPADGGADDVVAALRAIFEKTREETERMRTAAQARWNERCAIPNLLRQLFPEETEEYTTP